MIQDYFRLALRNARQRKLRSWLTMIGIFIGIAAIVSLLSLSQGLKDAIAQQFLQLGSDKLIVQAAGGTFGPPGTAVPAPLTVNDKHSIEKVKGVDLAVGRLIRIVQLEHHQEVKYTYGVSYPKNVEERQFVIEANNYKLEMGKFIENDDSFNVVLGHDFAQDFFEQNLELRDRILIQGKEFRITGILKKSGNPQQDSTLIIPEGTFRSLLSIPNNYDIIPLRVKSGEDINVVADRIGKELRKTHGVKEGEEDFIIETPQQIINTLNTVISIIQGILVGIAAVSLLVGGIGIMNTMYTSVLERTREIGILKAVGAQNKDIMFLFLIESGFLGFSGGLIGVFLGFSAGKMVEFIAFQVFGSSLIQATVTPYLWIGALLFSFVVGAASGVLPARQAAKLKPVEALRK